MEEEVARRPGEVAVTLRDGEGVEILSEGCRVVVRMEEVAGGKCRLVVAAPAGSTVRRGGRD